MVTRSQFTLGGRYTNYTLLQAGAINDLIGENISGLIGSDMSEEGDYAYENKSVDESGPSAIRAFSGDPWNRINMLYPNAFSLSWVGKRVSNAGTRSLSTLGSISG